jgi:hypothetical protein
MRLFDDILKPWTDDLDQDLDEPLEDDLEPEELPLD